MEKTFVEKIKKQLGEEKQKLQAQLVSFARRDKQVPGDWKTNFPQFKGSSLEEEADEVEEYENLLQIEAALETKLREVERALERIKTRTYGQCEKCLEEIEKERLETIPETKYCHKCKK